MRRYLQERFELNHNLTEARLAVLKGAIEMLEKMEHFFTHEHLTKKGDLKICYPSTIKDFLHNNSVTINNINIRGWFREEYGWQELEFFRDCHYNESFTFFTRSEDGSFIVDKKINLDMIAKAKSHFREKLDALEKHIKTRAALESQLLALSDGIATKFKEFTSVLEEWNNPICDVSKFDLGDKVKMNLYR